MKIQTAELSGVALNWAVSKARGLKVDPAAWLTVYRVDSMYNFSTDWTAGGPLLEECIEAGMLIERVDPRYLNVPKFKATLERWESVHRGDTLLVTTCRCYVAQKLGPEVEVPDEVLDPTVPA
jgi:hypothetical protein